MEFIELLKSTKQTPRLSEEEQRKLNNVLSNIGENVAELAGLLLKAYHLIPEDTPIEIRKPEFIDSKKKTASPSNGTVYPSTSDASTASKKRKRFPGEPKPPRSSFFHYLEDARKKLLTDTFPAGTDAIAQTKIIAVQWKNLPSEDKQVYTLRAQEDRNRYDRDIEIYCKEYPDRAADVLQEAKKFRRASEKKKPTAAATNGSRTIASEIVEEHTQDVVANNNEVSDDDSYFAADNQLVIKLEDDSPQSDEEEEIDEINDSDNDELQLVGNKKQPIF
ncbi:hypothetical protein BDF20DRAFT_857195 [Mycotypha africana]|uniref:uncharacterized protein n=1 Tax=Mycotypha africana TaxID=64632 RepID=UPI00230175C7|nr:uncharacterized protein BDF20DRAFT_857195 [Mycotypha africana]KAI8983951.1 hypothetical protein BDF20DRAFT_857195 [Mycotypha africana]